MAASNGWMERGQSLLRETDRCPEGDWLALVRGFTSSSPSEMRDLAEDAIALAREHGETDLEIVSLSVLGLALVYEARCPRA